MSEDNDKSKQPLEEIRQLINKVPAEELAASLSRRSKGDASSSVSLSTSSYFSGPLPPPHLLQAYKDIDEDFPNRIIESAEKEQQHRHDMDKSSSNFEKRGQLYVAAITIIAIVAGAVVTTLGNNPYASLIFAVPLIGLATLLITGRKDAKKQQDHATSESD